MGLVTTIKKHFNVPGKKMFIFNIITNAQSTEHENSSVNLRKKTKLHPVLHFYAAKNDFYLIFLMQPKQGDDDKRHYIGNNEKRY